MFPRTNNLIIQSTIFPEQQTWMFLSRVDFLIELNNLINGKWFDTYLKFIIS